jgi:hypothetical protein
MTVSKVFVLVGIICFLLAAFSVALGPFPPLALIALGLFFVHLPSLIV